LVESIVIILAALSRRNCTLFPLSLRPYPMDVTDGTQCEAEEIIQSIQRQSTLRAPMPQ
jgi:hypothetical protein